MLKVSIQDEIDHAMMQDRYRLAMPQTIKWLETMYSSYKFSKTNRIMNTGLIFYNKPDQILDLCNETYNACVDLKQPECQIIWGIYSQKYEHLITRCNFNDLNPPWMEPLVERFIFLKRLKFFFCIY